MASSDLDILQSRWEHTLGPDIDWTSLRTSCSYKPPAFQGEAPPLTERGFEPHEVIGQGGMGIVYRGRQASLRRDVALKTLRDDAQGGTRCMFFDEALINGSLEHPNIVPVYELGELPDGSPFLAMQMVEGRNWEEALRDDPDDLEAHLRIFLQVCHAVAFAHSRGVVHCDLKPPNVMLGNYGEVFLMDWGLAVGLDPDPEHGLRPRSSIDGPCGTPAYMPPELAGGDGELVDVTTDTYLLGGILHRLLAGRPPHAGDSFLQVLASSVRAEPPELPPDVPEELARICTRALSALQDRRFQSATELREAVEDFLRHRESHAIADRARRELEACGEARPAERESLYQRYAAAVAGFGQALELWPGNPEAARGREAARRAYAEAALGLGDLGLARAQAEELPAGDALHDRIARATARRARERTARTRLRAALYTLAGGFVLALCAGLYVLNEQNQALVAERQVADRAAAIALRSYDALAAEVHHTLTDVGSPEALGTARHLLGLSRDGWAELAALRDAASTVQGRVLQARLLMYSLSLGDAGPQAVDEALAALADEALALPQRAALLELHDDYLSWLRGQGRWEQSAEVCDRARSLLAAASPAEREALRPQRARLAVAEALADLRARDLASAEGRLRAALALVPADDFPGVRQRVLVALAELCFQRNELTRAQALLDEAWTLFDPESPATSFPMLLNMAHLCVDLGELLLTASGPDEAEAMLVHGLRLARTAQRRNPEAVAAWQAVARGVEALGWARERHFALDEASQLYAEALSLRRADTGTAEDSIDVASLVVDCARLAGRRGKTNSGLELGEEALAILRAITPEESLAEAHGRVLRGAILQLARLHTAAGNFDRAEELFDEGIPLARAWAALQTVPGGALMSLASGLRGQAELARRRGRLAEAEEAARQALDVYRQAIARFAGRIDLHDEEADALRLLSELALARQELARAADLSAEAVAARRAALEASPEQPYLRGALAAELNHAALLAVEQGALGRARPAVEEALSLQAELPYELRSDLVALSRLSTTLELKARVHAGSGENDAAYDAFRQCVELRAQAYQLAPLDPRTARDLALVHSNFGAFALANGQLDAAREALTEAWVLSARLVRLEPDNQIWVLDHFTHGVHLTECLIGLEDNRAALENARSTLHSAERLVELTPDVPFYRTSLARALSDLALCHLALGETGPALPLLDAAIDQLEDARGTLPDELVLVEEIAVLRGLYTRSALFEGEVPSAFRAFGQLVEEPVPTERALFSFAMTAWMLDQIPRARARLEPHVGLPSVRTLDALLVAAEDGDLEPLARAAEAGVGELAVILCALTGLPAMLPDALRASPEGTVLAYLKGEISEREFFAEVDGQADGRPVIRTRAFTMAGMRAEREGRFEDALELYERAVMQGCVDSTMFLWAWLRLRRLTD